MAQAQVPAGGSLLELVDLLYAVCDDLGRWPVFLRRLARGTGAFMALVHEIDLDAGSDTGLTAYPPDLAMRDRYNQRYGRLPENPWFSGELVDFLSVGGVFSDTEVLPAGLPKETHFYHRFLGPLGLRERLTVVFDAKGHRYQGLSLLRPEGTAPFDAEARALLGGLAPHLRRAFRLSGLLSGAQRLRLALEDTVERVPVGILLFGPDGRLVMANGRARRLLGEEQGLWLDREGRPQSPSPGVTEKLLRLLNRACAQADPGRPVQPGQLLLPRAGGRRPLSALVARVPAGPSDSQVAFAALFLSDPEERLAPRAELLQERCGLTPTEARIAAMLVQGLSVEEVAGALDSSLHTVRTHLKRIYAKTGTHRQASLVSLLVNSVGALDTATH